MSAPKGRYLAWYLDTSLGISENGSGAAGCPCVLGRDTAAVQADGHAWRSRRGPHGRDHCAVGTTRDSILLPRRVLLPLSHRADSLLMNRLGSERLNEPVSNSE